MKLIMAIVSSDDSRDVLDRLTKSGFRATVISTTGGFLREGNSTIFLGTEDQKVAQAIDIRGRPVAGGRSGSRRCPHWKAPAWRWPSRLR